MFSQRLKMTIACYEQIDYSRTKITRVDLDQVTIIEFCCVTEKDIKDKKNVNVVTL